MMVPSSSEPPTPLPTYYGLCALVQTKDEQLPCFVPEYTPSLIQSMLMQPERDAANVDTATGGCNRG